MGILQCRIALCFNGTQVEKSLSNLDPAVNWQFRELKIKRSIIKVAPLNMKSGSMSKETLATKPLDAESSKEAVDHWTVQAG